MSLHKLRDQRTVLDVAWQTLHVNVSHLIVFNQSDKEPKRDFFTAMQKECAYDEIHSLHVSNRRIVLRESLQDALQTLLALPCRLLEDLLVWERPRNITLNLALLSHAYKIFDAKQIKITLAALLNLKFSSVIGHLQPTIGGSASVGLRGRLTRALEAM